MATEKSINPSPPWHLETTAQNQLSYQLPQAEINVPGHRHAERKTRLTTATRVRLV